MIRVLLADDQALVRGGFRLILDTEPDMEVVAEAADGDQALAGALETRPDVVLMDIRMPVLDGIEATRRLVPQLGGTRVVILTTFDLDDYVVDAFRAGASGFLLKTAPPAQLIAAIRTVHAGDGLLAPASTRRLIEQFTQPAAPGPKLEALTTRESDVLRLLARGCPTPRSPRSSSSSRRRSSRTWRACWPSWACGTGCRRWCSPTRTGSSARANGRSAVLWPVLRSS
jgi:DNA-binding NarL/FixJ family response regulator